MVTLLRLPQVQELDVVEASLTVLMVIEECTESWVTIKARQTTPNDPGALVQQSAEVAIPDDGKV